MLIFRSNTFRLFFVPDLEVFSLILIRQNENSISFLVSYQGVVRKNIIALSTVDITSGIVWTCFQGEAI